MICEECLLCYNYMVCENGCYGSTQPCKWFQTDLSDEDIDIIEKLNAIPEQYLVQKEK